MHEVLWKKLLHAHVQCSPFVLHILYLISLILSEKRVEFGLFEMANIHIHSFIISNLFILVRVVVIHMYTLWYMGPAFYRESSSCILSLEAAMVWVPAWNSASILSSLNIGDETKNCLQFMSDVNAEKKILKMHTLLILPVLWIVLGDENDLPFICISLVLSFYIDLS